MISANLEYLIVLSKCECFYEFRKLKVKLLNNNVIVGKCQRLNLHFENSGFLPSETMS